MARAKRIYFVRVETFQPERCGWANVWIEGDSPDDALVRTRRFLRQNGWKCGKVDELGLGDPKAKGRKYYKQALIDKEVAVIYCGPSDAPEE